MPIRLDPAKRAAFEAVLPAIGAFKKAFARDLSMGFVAEIYAARDLDLQLPDRPNEPGADATDNGGQRYQIKHRSPSTLNVDLNNFNFDHLVLVNLDDDYRLVGMWSLPVEQAKSLFMFRERFGKYQATQDRVKHAATRVR